MVAVGAVDWYCDAVQTVSAVHTRSDVGVSATVWYWFALHTVAAVQVTVPEEDAYVSEGHAVHDVWFAVPVYVPAAQFVQL